MLEPPDPPVPPPLSDVQAPVRQKSEPTRTVATAFRMTSYQARDRPTIIPPCFGAVCIESAGAGHRDHMMGFPRQQTERLAGAARGRRRATPTTALTSSEAASRSSLG